MDEIHISRDGKSYGPYTPEQVETMLANGTLEASDWAWQAGCGSWVRLGDLRARPVRTGAAPRPDGAPLAVPRAPAATASAAFPDAGPPQGDPLSLGAAFSFPFRSEDWPRSMWWVAAMAYIPLFGLLLLRGWRVDITRRLGAHDPRPLPELARIGRFGADGLILWLISFLYWIPGLILIAVFSMDQLTKVTLMARWAFEKASGGELTMTLEGILTAIGLAGLAEGIIPFLYFMAIYPLYRAGMIRFALTDRVGCFFDVWTNLQLALKHFRDFMVVFFFDWAMVRVGIGILTVILAATGIGILLIPAVVLPTYYWTTGYLYGALAARVSKPIEH